MKTLKLSMALLLAPHLLGAQQDPVERLKDVLPTETAQQVLLIVTDAQARGLDGRSIANVALEGVAKGRSGEEVTTAAAVLVADLVAARGALAQGGRTPDAFEVDAAVMAMRQGVDGAAISDLVSSAPSGRSLAVPLAVIAGLMERGLPPDVALSAVSQRLAAQASDLELVSMPAVAAGMTAQGMPPAQVGTELASGLAGFTVPVGAVPIPVALPPGVPQNGGAEARPPNLPGRPAGSELPGSTRRP